MIKIDQALCNFCGECARICEAKDIEITDKCAIPLNINCSECGHCYAICPPKAIEIIGYNNKGLKEYKSDCFDIDPLTLLNFMQFRRSTRSFLPQKVEREKINLLLEAGRYSPTACNYQKLRYVVVNNDMGKVRDMLWDGAAIYAKRDGDDYLLERYKEYLESNKTVDALLYDCSQLIFILAPEENDACIASSRIELLANSLGLGALYLGYAKLAVEASINLQNYLGEDNESKTQVVIAIGYPNIKWQRIVPRKPLSVVFK